MFYTPSMHVIFKLMVQFPRVCVFRDKKETGKEKELHHLYFQTEQIAVR